MWFSFSKSGHPGEDVRAGLHFDLLALVSV